MDLEFDNDYCKYYRFYTCCNSCLSSNQSETNFDWPASFYCSYRCFVHRWIWRISNCHFSLRFRWIFGEKNAWKNAIKYQRTHEYGTQHSPICWWRRNGHWWSWNWRQTLSKNRTSNSCWWSYLPRIWLRQRSQYHRWITWNQKGSWYQSFCRFYLRKRYNLRRSRKSRRRYNLW